MQPHLHIISVLHIYHVNDHPPNWNWKPNQATALSIAHTLNTHCTHQVLQADWVGLSLYTGTASVWASERHSWRMFLPYSILEVERASKK